MNILIRKCLVYRGSNITNMLFNLVYLAGKMEVRMENIAADMRVVFELLQVGKVEM